MEPTRTLQKIPKTGQDMQSELLRRLQDRFKYDIAILFLFSESFEVDFNLRPKDLVLSVLWTGK